MNINESKQIIKDSFYFDIHGHYAGTIPTAWKIASFFRMPRDRSIPEIAKMGMGGVVCAIGDAGSFKKHHSDLYELTEQQIRLIMHRLEKAGIKPVLSCSDLENAKNNDSPAFVLGVEGGDFIVDDISSLGRIYNLGIRLLVPVHYSANIFGSISLGWGGRKIPESEHTGLTDFGRKIISECNRLGIILDLAHADDITLLETAAESTAPVICSHTGPLGLQKFERYLSDESIIQIADTGGIVGLWPYYFKGQGMEGPEMFKQAAVYLKNKTGADSVAIGTDFNGVPGYMKGFSDISKCGVLIKFLAEAGFSDEEIKKATGLNFLRVYRDVEESRTSD